MTATAAVARPAPRGWRAARGDGRWPSELLLVLPAWVVSRVLVLGADAVAHYLHTQVPQVRAVGLTAWDTANYAHIGVHGYGAAATPLLRFWPLLPAIGAAGHALGLPAGATLVVVSNVASLVLAVLLVRLGRREGWPDPVVRLLPWVVLLAPPAYVLVTGYAEALGAALTVGAFLALRSRRWSVAAGLGLLTGLVRPTGLLLALPALVEVVRARTARPAAIAALLAPLAGCAAYLAWVGARYGHPTYPYRVQQSSQLRGQIADPVTNLADAVRGTLHHQIGTGTFVPWLLLAVVLLVPTARRLPPSYLAFAAVTVVGTLLNANLFSTDRYLWSGFPLLVVTAMLVARSAEAARALLTLSAALLVAYALLSFVGVLPP